MVSLDVDTENLEKRILIWERLISLKSILTTEYWPEAIFDDSFLLENGKEISRIYLLKEGVSIHNKKTWQETMEFLNENMKQLEGFFLEYRDRIDS